MSDWRGAITWPEETDAYLRRIAVLTGRDGDRWRARVVNDAMAVYLWVLKQQLAGRTVQARGTWPDPGETLEPLTKVEL